MSAPEDDAAPRVRVAAVRAALFLGFWLMISGRNLSDLRVGLAAVAAATWTSLRLLPGGVAAATRVSGGARSTLRASVGRFGNGSRVARAQPEASTAPRFCHVSFAPAAGWSAERVLRSVQSAARNAANRDGRKRGAPRPLPRCRPAHRGQSGRGRDLVHPGARP